MHNLKHKQQEYEDVCKKAKEDAKIAAAGVCVSVFETVLLDCIVVNGSGVRVIHYLQLLMQLVLRTK